MTVPTGAPGRRRGDAPPMDLAALAEAAQRTATALAPLPALIQRVGDHVLDEGNCMSRTRFLRCDGCEDCATPLPVLTGDV